MNAPIFVTGINRSGTTVIAKIIHCCGAFAGSGAEQKKSMFENVYINKEIVRPYMERMGTDPRGQFPLPDISKISIPLTWKDQVETIMKREGYIDGAWMYKDTKMALIWNVWHTAFPDAKWVIVRRKTGDVIQSCLKTGYMTAYEDDKGWLEWIHEHEDRFRDMIDAGLNCKILWPERMINGDYTQLHEILEWLGLSWKEEALGLIDSLLWNKERSKKWQESPQQK
jgi:hypothetical protein